MYIIFDVLNVSKSNPIFLQFVLLHYRQGTLLKQLGFNCPQQLLLLEYSLKVQ